MKVLLKLLKRLSPYRWRIALVIASMFLGTFLMVRIPIVTGAAVDHLASAAAAGEGVWHVLAGSGALILLLTLGRGAMQYTQTALSGRVGQAVLFELRNDLFRHMQYLPFSYFDKAQTGQLLSRVTADVDSLRQFLGFGFVRLLTQIFQLLLIAISAFTLH